MEVGFPVPGGPGSPIEWMIRIGSPRLYRVRDTINRFSRAGKRSGVHGVYRWRQAFRFNVGKVSPWGLSIPAYL